jgi:adenylylsulfate reductase, subunit A
MPTEPYLLGSHSGCCGLWVSGPDLDWVPDAYKIKADNGKVYNRMTTVNGLFTSGDGVGCSGHKFSSGSHAEGRITAKQMVRYALDHADFKPTLAESSGSAGGHGLQAGSCCSWTIVTIPPRININPNYIKPNGMMYRMMKATHEYGAGTATYYQTSSKIA